MATLNAEGLAYLCFFENNHRFYGTMITKTREQFGLVGRCVDRATGNTDVHECCLGDSTEVMTITVIDHSNFNDEFVLEDVMKAGGDNCSLVSSNLTFYTDELLVGSKAETCIEKYFPSKFQNKGCLVCIGEMSIKITSLDGIVEKDISVPCCK